MSQFLQLAALTRPRALGPRHRVPLLDTAPQLAVLVAYLVTVAGAEYLTAAVSPIWGLPLHGLILLALLYDGSTCDQPLLRAFLYTLMLVPVIRILSLALPPATLPVIYWFGIISAPLFIAVAVGARALDYSARDLGLVPRLRYLPLCLLAVPIGAGLGFVEFRILHPVPLTSSLTPQGLWVPAAILIISTGFCEELVFRGFMQRAANDWLGPAGGMLYVSLLFATLHVGYLSPADVGFVFGVGLLFAVITYWTRSVWVAAVCHSAINVSFYLIWPFLLHLPG